MSNTPATPTPKDQGWRWLAAAAMVVWSALAIQFTWCVPRRRVLLVTVSCCRHQHPELVVRFRGTVLIPDGRGRYTLSYRPVRGQPIVALEARDHRPISVALDQEEDLVALDLCSLASTKNP